MGDEDIKLRRRRESLRRRRRRVREGAEDESNSSSSDCENPLETLTQEEYDEHLATVAHNQSMLKLWVDSAPRNFAHWFQLVEVLPSPLPLGSHDVSGQLPCFITQNIKSTQAERKRLELSTLR